MIYTLHYGRVRLRHDLNQSPVTDHSPLFLCAMVRFKSWHPECTYSAFCKIVIFLKPGTQVFSFTIHWITNSLFLSLSFCLSLSLSLLPSLLLSRSCSITYSHFLSLFCLCSRSFFSLTLSLSLLFSILLPPLSFTLPHCLFLSLSRFLYFTPSCLTFSLSLVSSQWW